MSTLVGRGISVGGGTPLPALTNPASNSDIRYSYEAIDGDGELLTGTIPDYSGQTSSGVVVPVLTNPATASDIVKDKEALNGNREKIVGTYETYVLPTLTNPASASDIASGKEAIDGQGQKITGTAPYNFTSLATGSMANLWKQATGFTSNKIVLDVPNVTSLNGVFSGATLAQNTEATINAPSSTTFESIFNNCTSIKYVKLTSCDFSRSLSFYNAFYHCTSLEEVDCEFEFYFGADSGVNYHIFDGCTALRALRFKPNRLKLLNGYAFYYCSAFTDETIISIANGLCEEVSKTLYLASTPKARTLAIMGTVSQVTEDGVTYNFFTADPEGTTSLNTFITTIKGWTLA